MRVNKRERTLLLVLVLAILAYSFYSFVYIRNIENIAMKEAELIQKKEQADLLLRSLEDEKDYNFELQALNFEVSNMSNSFLSEINQENVIVFLSKYFNQFSIDVESISFTDVSINAVVHNPSVAVDTSYPLKDLRDHYLSQTPTPPTATESLNTSAVQAESIAVMFDFTADYYDMLDFIEFMQTYRINFVIPNISINSNPIDTTVDGNTQMIFYAIPKIHEDKNPDWIWTDLIAYGSSNPFYFDNVNLDQYWTVRYDLSMILSPMELDIPSVNLGRYADDLYQSYVYADSNILENVEISIKEEDGQFFMKYSTKLGTYPSNYSQWVPFKPANDFISMVVQSMPRQSSEDQGGINLTVNNDTNLLFYINVYDEDFSRPRLNLETTNNVIVQKN